MVTVNEVGAAEHLRILRAHGWTRGIPAAEHELDHYPDIDPRYAFLNWGLNVRPTELQAGFGLLQIELANSFQARRIHLASKVMGYLSARTDFLHPPRVEGPASPSWLAIPLMVSPDAPFSKRDLMSYLENVGVETRPIVAGNLARQPAASRFPEFQERQFPGADEIHNRGFYVGLSPVQTDAAMDRLTEVFDTFLAKY